MPSGPPARGERPYWSTVLRAIREARGVTQDGWAALLATSPATVGRWESGGAVPNAEVEEALVTLCRGRGLFRAYESGPLRGTALTESMLRDLLAAARVGAIGARQPPAPGPAEPPGASASAAEPSPAPPPTNVPVPITSFVGRERELAEIAELLGAARLVTLTGPGGCGKTRLALEIAGHPPDRFPDGVFFVSLAPVREAGLVGSTIAQVLGVRESPGQTLLDSLKAYLREKAMLLVLDNFEQVVSAAPLVADLLTACPALVALVTSRIVLRVRGEREYAVRPLPLPARQSGTAEPGRGRDPLEFPAVRLFVERARAARADFAVTDGNNALVVEICQRLDGLPLAIELAAARSKVLTPAAMLARLSDRLKLLAGGPRDLPERHQTLRSAIAWSYDLLDEPERRLFRRLAVFTGGCTFEAIEAVCDADGDLGIDALDGVEALVAQSLLRQEEQPSGELRFVMLDTIREFGLEQLSASANSEVTHRRHAEHVLRLAQEAEPALRSAARGQWMERLRDEQGNIRAALAWALDAGEVALGVRIVTALHWWYRWQSPSEARRWGEALLALPGAAGRTAIRAAALHTVGHMTRAQGDQRGAREWLQEAVSIWREVAAAKPQHRHELANALVSLGWSVLSDPDRACELLEESIGLLREIGDTWRLSMALQVYALAAMSRDDSEAAQRALDECVALCEIHGEPWVRALGLLYLARLDVQDRNHTLASVRLEWCLRLSREAGDTFLIATALHDRAVLFRDQNELGRAFDQCVESLELYRREGIVIGIAADLETMAGILTQSGRALLAARLYGTAHAVRERLDYPLPAFREAYQQRVNATRAQLGDERFEQAWREGTELTIDQAVSDVLATAVQVP